MGFRDDHVAAVELAHVLAAEVKRERERAEAAEQAFAAIVRDRDQLQAELANIAPRAPAPPRLPWVVELPALPPTSDDDETASTARITLQILALVVIATVVAMIIANTGTP